MDPLKGFHVVPLHLIEKRYKINARLDYIWLITSIDTMGLSLKSEELLKWVVGWVKEETESGRTLVNIRLIVFRKSQLCIVQQLSWSNIIFEFLHRRRPISKYLLNS